MIKIDQLTAANEAAIAQFSQFAQLSLANLEKFAQLGLGAARENVEQATAHVQALAGAKATARAMRNTGNRAAYSHDMADLGLS